MKFIAATLLASLTTTCFAQTVSIISPLSNTPVFTGQDIKVVVQYSPSVAPTVSLYTAGFLPDRAEIDFIGVWSSVFPNHGQGGWHWDCYYIWMHFRRDWSGRYIRKAIVLGTVALNLASGRNHRQYSRSHQYSFRRVHENCEWHRSAFLHLHHGRPV